MKFALLRRLLPFGSSLPAVGWAAWLGLSGVAHWAAVEALAPAIKTPAPVRFEEGVQVIAAVLVLPPAEPLPEAPPPPAERPSVVAARQAAWQEPPIPPVPVEPPPAELPHSPEESAQPRERTEPTALAKALPTEPAEAPLERPAVKAAPELFARQETSGAEAAEEVEAILCPEPHYPRIARRRGLEGTVLLEVFIDASGVPLRVEVARSSGHRILDEAAVQKVSESWRWPRLGQSRTITVASAFHLR